MPAQFSPRNARSARRHFPEDPPAAARATKVVSILQELGGPKIRTGRLEGRSIVLKDGQTIRIVAGDGDGDDKHIYTTYGELVRKTHPGGRLLLDDGKIQLEIERAGGREIVARVVEGGVLEEHKGINAPGVQLSADALTPKDIEDLQVRRAARRGHGRIELRAQRGRHVAGAANPDRDWRPEYSTHREDRAA